MWSNGYNKTCGTCKHFKRTSDRSGMCEEIGNEIYEDDDTCMEYEQLKMCSMCDNMVIDLDMLIRSGTGVCCVLEREIPLDSKVCSMYMEVKHD